MKNKTIKIFWISLLIGYAFEFVLNALNIWAYDTLAYFLGVPVFIVFTWGFLLTGGFSLTKTVQKRYKLSLIKALSLIFIPSVIIFETIGSQVLGIVLNVDFPSLFPLTGCCRAPVALYVAYYLIALLAFRRFDKIR